MVCTDHADALRTCTHAVPDCSEMQLDALGVSIAYYEEHVEV